MTFEEWWDTSKSNSTPDTYKGWEESCRQAWEAGAAAKRDECARAKAAAEGSPATEGSEP